MKYDNETISQINNAVNVVDYASRYLELEERKGEYWTICPFHKDDVNPSLSFNKEKNAFYCFGCQRRGSTIQFVMEYHKFSFPKAIEHLIEYGNLAITEREHSDLVEFLHKLSKKTKEKEIQRTYLPDDIMNQYTKESITEWLNEGIVKESLDKFDVRYDKNGNRIVFSVRDDEGRILAVKGRTLYSNFRDLGIRKYSYYQPIGTNDFLFGLYENKNNIIWKNECIIVESEKSVMKLDGWGFDNAIALCTSHITPQQLNLLVSLKTNLVFAFDKDVQEKNIIKEIKKLSVFTNVYYVFDKQGLLKDKESPVDQGKEVWERLYEKRYKI